MTPEELTEGMQRLLNLQSDIEHDHVLADELLCKCLRELGYNEAIDVYEKLYKWYA